MLDKAAVSSVLVEVQRLVESVQSMLDKAAVSSMLVEVQRLVESVQSMLDKAAVSAIVSVCMIQTALSQLFALLHSCVLHRF